MSACRMLQCLCLSLSLVVPLFAQDGQQLYTLYCSACHGLDGKGATGGTFPPLAGSPFVAGEPDLAAKLVLNGLTGPVEVLGKSYNLEMPPQGAVLSDEQLATILTYVRRSWGNQAEPVSADRVKAIRATVADRTKPWTAAEILKLHPLPLEKTALRNLTSRVYSGDWKYLPDFTDLKPENIEEEHDGVMSLTDSPHREHFCMVWEATFDAPVDGEYYFRLDADDAARIIFDGTILTEIHGIGPMDGSRAQGDKSHRTKGPHSIRVEYLQYSGTMGLAIGWRGPGSNAMKWLTDPPAMVAKPRESIMLGPTDGRPVVYRNFIDGTTPRAIGVGFPGGLNLAYSTDHLAPELLWTGKFIDGAAKWLQRGTDPSPPAGENILHPTQSRFLPGEARFKGYGLDRAGNPTFKIQIGNQTLTDSWRVSSHPGNEDSKPALLRRLSLQGDGPGIRVILSDQLSAKLIDDQDYSFDGKFFIYASGPSPEAEDGKTFLDITPGQTSDLNYRWQK